MRNYGQSIVFVAVAAAFLCSAHAAHAQGSSAKPCFAHGTAPDARIAACTAVLQLKGKVDRVGALNQRGFALRLKGELKGAIADHSEAIKIDPASATAYFNRGVAYMMDRDFLPAISDMRKAISLAPQRAPFHEALGLAYYRNQQVDLAVASYDEAIRLGPPNSAVFNNRGLAYLANEQFDQAIADFDRAIILSPLNSNAFAARGTAYREKGDLDRALQDYERANALKPNSPSILLDRGRTLQKKGDLEAAIKDYDAVISLDPKNEIADELRSSAPRAKERARGDNSRDADAHYANADAFSEAGFPYLGLEEIDQAIAMSPDRAAFVERRGYLNYDAGHFSDAVRDFRRALELNLSVGSRRYVPLYVFLAQARQNQDGKSDLKNALDQVVGSRWPLPIYRLYLGDATADEVMAAATNKDERCEAAFYVGAFHLVKNDRREAPTALLMAAASCPKDFVEWRSANAELNRLAEQVSTWESSR